MSRCVQPAATAAKPIKVKRQVLIDKIRCGANDRKWNPSLVGGGRDGGALHIQPDGPGGLGDLVLLASSADYGRKRHEEAGVHRKPSASASLQRRLRPRLRASQLVSLPAPRLLRATGAHTRSDQKIGNVRRDQRTGEACGQRDMKGLCGKDVPAESRRVHVSNTRSEDPHTTVRPPPHQAPNAGDRLRVYLVQRPAHRTYFPPRGRENTNLLHSGTRVRHRVHRVIMS